MHLYCANLYFDFHPTKAGVWSIYGDFNYVNELQVDGQWITKADKKVQAKQSDGKWAFKTEWITPDGEEKNIDFKPFKDQIADLQEESKFAPTKKEGLYMSKDTVAITVGEDSYIIYMMWKPIKGKEWNPEEDDFHLLLNPVRSRLLPGGKKRGKLR